MIGNLSRAAWVVGLLASSVAASTLVATPAQAVVGDEVKEGQHAFTAQIRIGDKGRVCSGALIDPRWVLTAASCFAEDPKQGFKIPAGEPKQKTVVRIGKTERSPLGGLTTLKVAELVPHGDRDLVMARLTSPLSDITTPDQLKAPAFGHASIPVGTTPPSKGEVLRFSGFGRTKDEWVPERMHSAEFTVDSVDNNAFGVSGKTPTDASICSGDAGGPAFREKDGSAELVGINVSSWQAGCFGMEDETRNGASMARVDDVNSWVQKVRLLPMRQRATNLVTSADFNGDGRPDIAAVLDDHNLYAFYTTTDGKLEFGRELWALDRSWDGIQKIAGGDFNGDGLADIAAIARDGSLRLYPGTKNGPLGSSVNMWKDTTWDGMPHIARYKADASGRDSLLAITKDGSLYAYPTAPSGQLLDQRREMWQDKTWSKKLISTGDFNGDGRDDIAAIASNGAMHLYRGNAAGRFDSGTPMWSDNTWDTYRALMGGDFNGDGRSDIAAINGAGDLYLYPSKADGTLDGRSAMWPTVS